jgi:cyclic-di-AMP phosphodiesterase PgpH
MKAGKEKSRGAPARRARWAEAWKRFRQAGGPRAFLLAAIFAAGTVLLDVWPPPGMPYRAGQYVTQDIRARIDFSVISPKRLEDARAQARNTTPATFRLDDALLARLEADLKTLPDRLSPYTQPATLPESLARPYAISTTQALGAWRACTEANLRLGYEETIYRLAERLRRLPLVSKAEKEEQAARGAAMARLGDELRPTQLLVGVDEVPKIESEVRQVARLLPEPLRRGAEAYLLGVFTTRQQPLYLHDANATQKDIDDGLQAVEANPPRDTYQAGAVLVERQRKERAQVLTQADLELLRREDREFENSERGLHPVRFVLRYAGREALLLFVVALACGYAWRYRPEVAGAIPRDPSREPAAAASGRVHGFAGDSARGGGCWLAGLLLAMLACGKILVQVFELNPFSLTLPILVGTFVLTIAYDQRFALAVGGCVTALAVFLIRGDLSMLLALAGGLGMAVALLREVRTRTKVIQVSAAAGAVVLLGAWTRGMAQGAPWWPVAMKDGLWGAGWAILAGFFVQGILPLVERVFGVATSMTLLEWCDADKPLLRRLRLEAPGTYSHCLQLGAICEAAADAIGAWGLLARAGAYYHDIGKIHKPEYFVENEAGGASRHARLSPAMSLLVITGHVRDGLELAREYGLPPVLREFIATHHGTTLAQYFFQAETDRRREQEDRAPEESDFRYPGPKPRSREAAILMLADAVETSIRSMPEATPGRIENQVHAMVNRRLMDGQLDECELKLREVWKIEESFVTSMTAMHHWRPAYPTPPGEEPSAAEVPPPSNGQKQA